MGEEYGAIRHSDWKWVIAEIERLKAELDETKLQLLIAKRALKAATTHQT
jgi:hypothetical protein